VTGPTEGEKGRLDKVLAVSEQLLKKKEVESFLPAGLVELDWLRAGLADLKAASDLSLILHIHDLPPLVIKTHRQHDLYTNTNQTSTHKIRNYNYKT